MGNIQKPTTKSVCKYVVEGYILKYTTRAFSYTKYVISDSASRLRPFIVLAVHRDV